MLAFSDFGPGFLAWPWPLARDLGGKIFYLALCGMSSPAAVFEGGGGAGSRHTRFYLYYYLQKNKQHWILCIRLGGGRQSEIMQQHKYSSEVSDLHQLCFRIYFGSEWTMICSMPGHWYSAATTSRALLRSGVSSWWSVGQSTTSWTTPSAKGCYNQHQRRCCCTTSMLLIENRFELGKRFVCSNTKVDQLCRSGVAP